MYKSFNVSPVTSVGRSAGGASDGDGMKLGVRLLRNDDGGLLQRMYLVFRVLPRFHGWHQRCPDHRGQSKTRRCLGEASSPPLRIMFFRHPHQMCALQPAPCNIVQAVCLSQHRKVVKRRFVPILRMVVVVSLKRDPGRSCSHASNLLSPHPERLIHPLTSVFHLNS